MSIKLDRAVKRIVDLERAVNLLTKSMARQTQLVQQLLDSQTGLDEVVKDKVEDLIKEQIEVEVGYELTREVLEGLRKGGIVGM